MVFLKITALGMVIKLKCFSFTFFSDLCSYLFGMVVQAFQGPSLKQKKKNQAQKKSKQF